jgi:dinuclear metal center YbgI/SA1388 family protein
MRVSQLNDFFDRLYPFALAEDWDNVGLIVGNPRAEVESVLFALDVLPEVVDEAIAEGCNVIVTHHPLIFRAIKRVKATEPQGELIARLFKHDISAIALHTNLDSAEGGLNDTLCELLKLGKVRPLVDSGHERFFKLAVTVPTESAERVRQAMCEAGAGEIGDYRECSFSVEGTGTFRGLEGHSKPVIGTAGSLEHVRECRLEVILRREISGRVVEALKQAHPYEEIAYDLYLLHNKEGRTGLARQGLLAKAETLDAFVKRVQELGIFVTRVLGEPGKEVRKVALCSGAGSDFVGEACSAGADVYVTAELKHHHGAMARHADMALVETEHYSLERMHWPKLAKLCEREFKGLKTKVSKRESLHWRPA